MKVGIITFHRVNNYGAVLQAYALQKSIQALGCECDILDYGRKNLRDVLLWQKNKLACCLKGKPDKQGYSNLEFLNMFLTTIFFNNKMVANKFHEFRKRLSLSSSVNSDTIRALNPYYDLFLSGSDQVWNCGRVIMDPSYFLDFVEDKNKKGSYAASFGIKEIPDKYSKDYKSLLSQYKYLAVRETAGAQIIHNLLDREAQVVLDPTLLLSSKEWFELIGKKQKVNSVIVVYMLEYSENLLKFARELSKKTNCPIRLLNKPYKHKIKEEFREDVGPMEWLEELQNAKYVVTNSFHGVAFSINFNKDFFVEIAEERIRGAMSSRIEHILNIFGLEERLINHQSCDEDIVEQSVAATDEYEQIKSNQDDRYTKSEDTVEGIELVVNYRKVNHKLEELRIASKGYLSNMLKCGGNL